MWDVKAAGAGHWGVALLVCLGVVACAAPVPKSHAPGSKALVYNIQHRKSAGPAFAAQSASTLYKLSMAACDQVASGKPVATAAKKIQTESVLATPTEYVQFVDTSIINICSQFVPQIPTDPAAPSFG